MNILKRLFKKPKKKDHLFSDIFSDDNYWILKDYFFRFKKLRNHAMFFDFFHDKKDLYDSVRDIFHNMHYLREGQRTAFGNIDIEDNKEILLFFYNLFSFLIDNDKQISQSYETSKIKMNEHSYEVYDKICEYFVKSIEMEEDRLEGLHRA